MGRGEGLTSVVKDGWPTQARFWLEWGRSDCLNSVTPAGGDRRETCQSANADGATSPGLSHSRREKMARQSSMPWERRKRSFRGSRNRISALALMQPITAPEDDVAARHYEEARVKGLFSLGNEACLAERSRDAHVRKGLCAAAKLPHSSQNRA
jgi:hypothetical protein